MQKKQPSKARLKRREINRARVFAQPMKSIIQPGIPMSVVRRLLEYCDTIRQQDMARHHERQRIWIVECDGETYTVAIDYKKLEAMVVRGDKSQDLLDMGIN